MAGSQFGDKHVRLAGAVTLISISKFFKYSGRKVARKGELTVEQRGTSFHIEGQGGVMRMRVPG
jgi:hypothetical protein